MHTQTLGLLVAGGYHAAPAPRRANDDLYFIANRCDWIDHAKRATTALSAAVASLGQVTAARFRAKLA